jgi:hypothetical protein
MLKHTHRCVVDLTKALGLNYGCLFALICLHHRCRNCYQNRFPCNNTIQARACHYYAKKIKKIFHSTNIESMNIVSPPASFHRQVPVVILHRMVWFELNTTFLRYGIIFFNPLHALNLYQVRTRGGPGVENLYFFILHTRFDCAPNCRFSTLSVKS